MNFSATFYIYFAITVVAWPLLFRFRKADPRKTPMLSFLTMITLAYSFQTVSNFVFPTPHRDGDPFFIRIHLFTWFVHFLSMTIALFHLSRIKKGIPKKSQRIIAQATLSTTLTGLVATYFFYFVWIDQVPFRHLPSNFPEFIFVESYYLGGAILLFLTLRNLVDIVLHEKRLAQRARAIFSGLAVSLGWLYYVIKAIFALLAILLNLSNSNYPIFFQHVETLTLYLLISVVVLWAVVFLPSHITIMLATPFDYIRKVVTLNYLQEVLQRISPTVKPVSLQAFREVDLSIIETATHIMDLRDTALSDTVAGSSHQWLHSIKDSTDIWDVVESCVALRHRIKSNAIDVI